ncbi:TPA: ATPase V [Streptococcus pyogenes]|nr:ATPase V [Streptococcus pyogenes]
MNDITQLRQNVLEKAHQEGQQCLKIATDSLDTDFKERQQQGLHDLKAKRQKELKALEQQFQVAQQQLKNQERQALLALKQDSIKELFEASLEKMTNFSKEEELAFLKQVLSKYSEQPLQVTFGEKTGQKFSSYDCAELRLAFPQLSYNQELISQEAGFLVSLDQVDDNYLYRYLLESVLKEESSRIIDMLFSEI